MKRSTCAAVMASAADRGTGARRLAGGIQRNASSMRSRAGPVCMDKYEASVWQVPATNPSGGSNKGLIAKIQKGTAKLADLANVARRSSA